MEYKKDEVTPKGKWSFDGDVTEVFDDMLQRSVPQYNIMRAAVEDLAKKFYQGGTDIVDLGSSRGEAVARLIEEKIGPRATYYLCEISDPMLDVLRGRFKRELESGWVRVRKVDLRREYPPVRASVTQAVLTIQFTPIEYRQRIIQNVYDSTVEGGIFLLVEKVLGMAAAIDDAFVGLYLDLKRQNGYTEDQILRKRMSLEGVLVPVTSEMNKMLLRQAGFRRVDCFWRWMNFAAWLAIK